jgi:hypothetical protein
MRLLPLIVLLVAPAFSVQAEQVYRWVDENGGVHYSATPPEGKAAEERNLRYIRNPDPAAAEAAQKRWSEQDKQRATAQQEAAAQGARSATERAERARNCQTAREIISRLESAPATRYRQEDGSYRMYTPDEIAQKVSEAREREREYCD